MRSCKLEPVEQSSKRTNEKLSLWNAFKLEPLANESASNEKPENWDHNHRQDAKLIYRINFKDVNSVY